MSKSKLGAVLALAAVVVAAAAKVLQGQPPSFEEIGLALAAVFAAFGAPIQG